MEGATDYHGNSRSALIDRINEEENSPKEYSARLGFYKAQYKIVFKLSECKGDSWFCSHRAD